ncbi:MAG: Holliday junction branch migration protein RuvA [Planctomycetota bacterium]|nr:MAG: Holliday junction branch migration protein RuvA [Planctomycetota bacterium]
MYDFFRGVAVQLDPDGNVSLDVQGVGYRLRVSQYTRRAIPLDGSTVLLHARMVVREDEHLLFGFYDPAERAAFDLLTAVQGVGPAVAMAILSTLGVDELRRSLHRRDVAALKKVKGVGAKSAERMVLELADKVERIPLGVSPSSDDSSDATAAPATLADDARSQAHRALVALGFSVRESEQALANVEDQDSSEAYVRASLGILRRV